MASSTEYTDPLYDPTTGQPSQANLDTKPLDPSDPNFDPNVNNATTTWSSGPDSHPTSTYAGWTWDPTMFRYQRDAPSAPAAPPPPSGNDPGPVAPPPSVAPPAQPANAPTAPAIPPGSPSSYLPPDPNAPAAPPAAPPAAAAPPSQADTDFRTSIRSQILAALGQGPVSASDEDIAPAIAANRVATQRGLDDQKAAIAERLNAQGLTGSGSLDQQMQAAMERATTSEAQFSGNAVLNQAIARRQQLTSLLSLGSSVMSADDARQLQGRIADIDAYLRQQSITNQDTQANTQFGLTGGYYEALLQQQQIRDLLGV